MNFPFSLRDSAEFDVVGFGTNAVDYLIEVPHYPAYTSKVALTTYKRSPGGEIASTLTGLSRLGFSTAYVGRFGDDEAGIIGRASLEDEGVSTQFAETCIDTPNQIAFIVIDEKTGERTVIWQRDARLGYRGEEAPTGAASMGRVLHITAHDLDASIEMANAARSAGTIVSADIDKAIDGIDRLLPLVDLLTLSSDFPEQLTGIGDHAAALGEIARRYGNRFVGVTLGFQGSLIYCEDRMITTSGYEVPGGCRDTTGAGDAFRAGLLFGLLCGKSVEKSAQSANAVAALKCRRVGARTALPTRAELIDFIDQA